MGNSMKKVTCTPTTVAAVCSKERSRTALSLFRRLLMVTVPSDHMKMTVVMVTMLFLGKTDKMEAMKAV